MSDASQPPQPPQPPYGAPQYGYGYRPPVPDHPQAVTVLVLGILGILACQIVAPFAWHMGNRVVKEIDASNGTLGGRSQAEAGRICGIVGTFLIGLTVLIMIFVLVIFAGTAITQS